MLFFYGLISNVQLSVFQVFTEVIDAAVITAKLEAGRLVGPVLQLPATMGAGAE
jgi:hypothetical protein